MLTCSKSSKDALGEAAGQFFYRMDGRQTASSTQQIEIYRHLVRLSADNEGLEAIARALAQYAHKGVLIQDKRLQPLAHAHGQEFKRWAEIVEALGLISNLPPQLVDRKRAAEVKEPIRQQLQACARLVLPIVTRNVARGYLSLIHTTLEFDAVDRMVLEQGALICAVEMAKVKAVSETEKKLRGDLIEAVLTGAIGETEAVRWAERLGFRRNGPYVAITLQWGGSDAPSLRRLETIVNGMAKRHRSRTLASARDGEIVVFYAATPERAIDEPRLWAQMILNQAREEFPHAHLAIGIGRAVEGLLLLRQSYREATQAMALERRLRHHRPQFYGDLGVYRLLLQLDGTPELRAFSEQVLGPLIRYDREEKANLLTTLRVYFQHNGNVAQTAKELFIHRNTLLYRLERIRTLANLDLDDAETRFQLQVALRAYELARDAQ